MLWGESGRGLLLVVEVLAERRVVGERELGQIVRCKFTLVDGGHLYARVTPTRLRRFPFQRFFA
ncbi:hypothetical protein ACWGNN_45060, partial [Streptomyces sp. NPDC055817]